MLTVNDIRKKLVQEKLVLEIYKKEYNETGEYDNHMIELINFLTLLSDLFKVS